MSATNEDSIEQRMREAVAPIPYEGYVFHEKATRIAREHAEERAKPLRALLRDMEIEDVDGDGDCHWFRCRVDGDWLDRRDAALKAEEAHRG